MASSRLVDKPTYNDGSVYPAMINSRGIDMELQFTAADYSNGPESIAPIPKRGTEAESEPTLSSIDRSMDVGCSVEAAQRDLWHEAMNKHGIYRPRGVVRVLPNGLTQWREHARTRWCKSFQFYSVL